MSTSLLDSIKQQATGLSPRERARLIQFLNELSEAPPLSSDDIEERERKRRLRAEWLKAHGEEYAGLYVALDGDRLVGTGRNYPEAFDAAKRAGVCNAYVGFVYPADYEGYMGGW